jgi:hypothetical protein
VSHAIAAWQWALTTGFLQSTVSVNFLEDIRVEEL